jgi:2-isopropylmalate synthase
MGEANVRIANGNGKTFIGRGVSTDIIEASAKAYVDALNRMAAAEKNAGNESTIVREKIRNSNIETRNKYQ